ncbi:MAG: LemA family protein [Terrimicrobiaceae bacterium]
MAWWILLVPAALAVWGLWVFNAGVRHRNQQAEAWSGVDVQLKKRHDLVPPLVECVRAYRAHEAGTFEKVAARGESGVVEAMRGLLALAEAYPELKATQNFQQLTAQLVVIEDDLQYARRYYNGSVRDYRNFAESFPTNLLAGFFQFSPGQFFEVENVIERQAPQVGL